MVLYFNGGVNKVWYRATNFQSGLDVQVKIIAPDFNTNLVVLQEWKNEGVYWFDFNFNKSGTWLGIVYENGKKVTSDTFHIDASHPGIVTHN